jgi:YidC/Oxa1 family membrane protein insertase
MKLDKTTIIALAACMLALVLTPVVVNKLYPPRPKPLSTPAWTVDTNAAPVTVASSNGVAVASTSLPLVEPVTPPKERPPEEVMTLSNNVVKLDITTWGGGIKSVELLQHKENGKGNVILNGRDAVPSLALHNIPGAGVDAGFVIASRTDRSVTLTTTTAQGVTIEKELKLTDDYRLDARVTVTGMAQLPTLNVVVGTATPSDEQETPDYLASAWMSNRKLHTRLFKQADKGNGTPANPVTEDVSASWAAVKSQFFAMVLTPSTNATIKAVGYYATNLSMPTDWKLKSPARGLTTIAHLASQPAATGDRHEYDISLYTGPKEYGRLQELGADQELVMDFGFWGAISVILLKGMNFFFGLIPNYGIAIIIITIIIKILFWPIQAKSIKSMKEMQKFQPLMAKLREKYKDDPQRMNAEMMKLYKEHKINPFAGCLPMVVQIPVFFALFSMLRTAIELRGASFLWIHDLSRPDTIAHLAGFAINPLPLVMGATMIWQMKLTPSGGDPKQQQMMMIMPVVFLFICYSMSSGLVLYWTVQQVLSIAQQWWSMRESTTALGVQTKPATTKS